MRLAEIIDCLIAHTEGRPGLDLVIEDEMRALVKTLVVQKGWRWVIEQVAALIKDTPAGLGANPFAGEDLSQVLDKWEGF